MMPLQLRTSKRRTDRRRQKTPRRRWTRWTSWWRTWRRQRSSWRTMRRRRKSRGAHSFKRARASSATKSHSPRMRMWRVAFAVPVPRLCHAPTPTAPLPMTRGGVCSASGTRIMAVSEVPRMGGQIRHPTWNTHDTRAHGGPTRTEGVRYTRTTDAGQPKRNLLGAVGVVHLGWTGCPTVGIGGGDLTATIGSRLAMILWTVLQRRGSKGVLLPISRLLRFTDGRGMNCRTSRMNRGRGRGGDDLVCGFLGFLAWGTRNILDPCSPQRRKVLLGVCCLLGMRQRVHVCAVCLQECQAHAGGTRLQRMSLCTCCGS